MIRLKHIPGKKKISFFNSYMAQLHDELVEYQLKDLYEKLKSSNHKEEIEKEIETTKSNYNPFYFREGKFDLYENDLSYFSIFKDNLDIFYNHNNITTLELKHIKELIKTIKHKQKLAKEDDNIFSDPKDYIELIEYLQWALDTKSNIEILFLY